MRSLRKWVSIAGGLVICLLLIGTAIGCGTSASTATTAVTAGASTTTAITGGAPSTTESTAATVTTTPSTGGASSTEAAAPGGPIKVGVILDFSFPLSVQGQKELQAYVPWLNEHGGVTVGGKQYTFDMIYYDSKSNADTARAAVERLVNQDKVDYILGDSTVDSWLSVTEPAKKLVIATTPTPGILQPIVKLGFNTLWQNTQAPVVWNWLVKHVDFQTVSGAYADTAEGHAEADRLKSLAPAFGKKIIDIEFYPPTTQDFSAIATKLLSGNPDAFTTQGGGPVNDSLLFKAMTRGGFKGQLFNTVPLTPAQIARVTSLSDVEGLIGAVPAIETDNPPATAQQLKDVYVAKYGSWDNPDMGSVGSFYLLTAAMQKAQSLDPEQLAAVIANGLQFDTPNGTAQMVNRPDLGNQRTVDCCYETRIGQIVQGKSAIKEVIPIDQVVANAATFFSPK
jgi:branched-chain amino acid transport system substrate-binding protein